MWTSHLRCIMNCRLALPRHGALRSYPRPPYSTLGLSETRQSPDTNAHHTTVPSLWTYRPRTLHSALSTYPFRHSFPFLGRSLPIRHWPPRTPEGRRDHCASTSIYERNTPKYLASSPEISRSGRRQLISVEAGRSAYNANSVYQWAIPDLYHLPSSPPSFLNMFGIRMEIITFGLCF